MLPSLKNKLQGIFGSLVQACNNELINWKWQSALKNAGMTSRYQSMCYTSGSAKCSCPRPSLKQVSSPMDVHQPFAAGWCSGAQWGSRVLLWKHRLATALFPLGTSQDLYSGSSHRWSGHSGPEERDGGLTPVTLRFFGQESCPCEHPARQKGRSLSPLFPVQISVCLFIAVPVKGGFRNEQVDRWVHHMHSQEIRCSAHSCSRIKIYEDSEISLPRH